MHEKTRIEGVAAPLMISNLDTDQIMPKQFLKIVGREGLERGALHDLRFTPEGARREDFILHQPAYRDANILVGGPNFGCGSSREHAVWGLQQLGIEAVIASGFGEIFYGNAMNNRLLPVLLDEPAIAALLREIVMPATNRISIDIVAGVIRTAAGTTFPFTLAPRYRDMIVEGLDMVDTTLRMKDVIEEFERRHHAGLPWVRISAQMPQA